MRVESGNYFFLSPFLGDDVKKKKDERISRLLKSEQKGYTIPFHK